MDSKGFNAADVWEKRGITEHLGGIPATVRLIQLCGLRRDALVLDIGCGTGYTACMLAKQYGLRVIAADISAKVLRHARERVIREGVQDRVALVQSDVHALAFAPETFDAVICESVLVFCDQPRALCEIQRVLKRSGVLGLNEFTFLKTPPPEWKTLLSAANFGLALQPLHAHEWEDLLEGASLSLSAAETARLSLRAQFASHIRVDGWRKYLTAVARNLMNRAVWKTFFSREMLRGWRQYPAYVGYGLYVGQKI